MKQFVMLFFLTVILTAANAQCEWFQHTDDSIEVYYELCPDSEGILKPTGKCSFNEDGSQHFRCLNPNFFEDSPLRIEHNSVTASLTPILVESKIYNSNFDKLALGERPLMLYKDKKTAQVHAALLGIDTDPMCGPIMESPHYRVMDSGDGNGPGVMMEYWSTSQTCCWNESVCWTEVIHYEKEI